MSQLSLVFNLHIRVAPSIFNTPNLATRRGIRKSTFRHYDISQGYPFEMSWSHDGVRVGGTRVGLRVRPTPALSLKVTSSPDGQVFSLALLSSSLVTFTSVTTAYTKSILIPQRQNDTAVSTPHIHTFNRARPSFTHSTEHAPKAQHHDYPASKGQIFEAATMEASR